MINKFDKHQATVLRAEIEAHMKPFLEARGLSLKLGNAKFTEGMVRFIGTEFSIPTVAGQVHNVNLAMWLRAHGIIGTADKRETFESKEYVLTDYRSRAPKRPWVARSKLDGKTYVLTDAQARIHFSA